MITSDDRILITGAAGALGEAVSPLFAGLCSVIRTDISPDGPSCVPLDISFANTVRSFCADSKPTAIVNLAAVTDLERCESNPRGAYDTNGWGVLNLVREARRHDIPFVHISTAGVFDGEQDFYSEDDAYLARPLNIYGKSKYLGELIAGGYSKSIVIRSGWMIGGGPDKDKKFVGKIVDQIRGGARELTVVDDKFGTPSYTYDIAALIRHLLDTRSYGLYHGCCAGHGSRMDVTRAILAAFGAHHSISVRAVPSDHFRKEYFALRPRSERLTASLVSFSRPWEHCLAEYLDKFDWGIRT